jgi:hypothetical protein
VTQVADIPPIFVSVKEAARMLSLTPWSVYQLLNDQQIESRYHGKRRLVVLASLQEYADRLPTTQASA